MGVGEIEKRIIKLPIAIFVLYMPNIDLRMLVFCLIMIYGMAEFVHIPIF